VLKLPLPRSEELLSRVKERLGPNRSGLIIGVDGPDGVGKSSLASWLSWQLGTPTVHLDLYIVSNRKPGRPLEWRTEEVTRIIGARIDAARPRPVVVEGILLLDVLETVQRTADFLGYVHGEGSRHYSTALADYRTRREPGSRADFTLTGFERAV
jgi:hypothetical protein